VNIDHLSYSQISSYMLCPRQYYFSRVVKKPFVESYWPYLGKVGHYTVAEYFRGKRDGEQMSRDQLKAMFADQFDSRMLLHERAEGIDWKDLNEGNVKDMGIILIDAFLESSAADISPVDIEFEWEVTVDVDGESVPILGRVDMIDESGRVIDWKFSKRKMSQRKADRALQPTVYALGMGGPITFAYGFVLKHIEPKVKFVETYRSNYDLSWVRDEIIPWTWRMITDEIFPPCDPSTWICQEKYCDHFDICRGAGSTDEKLW